MGGYHIILHYIVQLCWILAYNVALHCCILCCFMLGFICILLRYITQYSTVAYCLTSSYIGLDWTALYYALVTFLCLNLCYAMIYNVTSLDSFICNMLDLWCVILHYVIVCSVLCYIMLSNVVFWFIVLYYIVILVLIFYRYIVLLPV